MSKDRDLIFDMTEDPEVLTYPQRIMNRCSSVVWATMRPPPRTAR